MTESQSAYVTETVTKSDERKAWRCPGCNEVIGYIYRQPRRLVIVTDDDIFVLRGDAQVKHHCGAVMEWVWRREQSGILDELEMTQNIIETEELGVTDLDNLC